MLGVAYISGSILGLVSLVTVYYNSIYRCWVGSISMGFLTQKKKSSLLTLPSALLPSK